MLRKLSIGAIIFVLLTLATSTVAYGEETKTIKADGVPVVLDNLRDPTPTVEVTISDSLQLTIKGLDTRSDPPPGSSVEPRRPDTLAFYVYSDFPELAGGCLLTPQPSLTTLPPGAVTEQSDGTFVLTFNLRDLKQNACPQPLQAFISDGPFGSRLEVSDNYGAPVLYSESYVADLTPDVPPCMVGDPADGINEATAEIYALDLDPKAENKLIKKLDKVEKELLKDPPNLTAARHKVFNFVRELEHAVDKGDLAPDEANTLLNLAGSVLASLEF